MPWSKHYYAVAEPRRKSTGGGEAAKGDTTAGRGGAAKMDDDSLLSLSLGDIYNNNNAPAAVRANAYAAAAAGFRRSPVVATTMPPAPVLPADVLGAPSVAVSAVHPPPLFDSLVVESSGGAFFPAAAGSAPTLPHQMASNDGGGSDIVIPTPMPHPDATAAAAASPTPRPATKRSRRRSSTTTSPPHATNGRGGNDAATVEIDAGVHISPPYPWSTSRVGVHHSLAELSNLGISTITGELQCKRCDDTEVVSVDIKAKFEDLCGYISGNVHGMDDRAPKRWREPALPVCGKCGVKGTMRPVIPADKHKINWVFLLLTETLGVCTLEQLKHFCAHTRQHRTGAKDRVLYSTYMELCNQLLPNGIFDMESERRKRTRLNV